MHGNAARTVLVALTLALVSSGQAATVATLHVTDLAAARRDLEARGAKVTHILPAGRLVAVLPDGFVIGSERLLSSMPLAAQALEGLSDELLIPDLETGDGPDSLAAASGQSPALVGDVVLALALPDSTGESEPDLVSWTPADVNRAVATAVAGTLRLALAPGAPTLRFHIHLLSAPAPGGTTGTVACAREAFRYSNFDTRVDGSWLAALGYPGDVVEARRDLTADLRQAYDADAAYIGKVIHSGLTPPGQASALLGGPQVTWFLSSTPYAVMHETAHAFGAQDEYCPDACRSPSLLTGTAQAANANSRGNDGSGYFGGAGEGLPCIMLRDTDRICPHTRFQLGWGDVDIDGVPDAHDRIPVVTVAEATIQADAVVVRGHVLVGAGDSGAPRVASVEVRVAPGPWIAAIADDGAFDRKREAFTAYLPVLPNGDYRIEARASTENGRHSIVPATSDLRVTDSPIVDAAPWASVTVRPTRARAGSAVRFDAVASNDLENSQLVARFDFDGDGNFDTDFGALAQTHRYTEPGSYPARVEVRDSFGNLSARVVAVTATADDLPPVVLLSVSPAAVHGETFPELVADASQSFDPEGDALRYRYSFGLPGEELGPGPELRAQHAIAVGLSEAIPVTVTVTDSHDNSTTVTRAVPVITYNHQPSVTLVIREGTDPGESLLDATAAFDPDHATLWDGLLAYRFDFEGDGIFDTEFATDRAVVAHRYEAERSYRPVVEVRDRFSASARAEATLELRSVPVFDDGVQLDAAPSACGADLTWAAATAAAGPVTYGIYRAPKGATDWTLVGESAMAGFRDTGARSGHEYTWLVRAWAPGAEPLEDDNVETATAFVPNNGAHLTAVRGEDNLVSFRWSPAGAATLMASPAKGSEYRAVAIGDSGTSIVSTAPIAFFEVSLTECRASVNIAAR